MTKPLSIGYSPCPNDTYIFYGLMSGRIPLSQIRFETEQLEDVETLNSWALAKKLDVTKLSFHALGHVGDTYSMLNAGAALGRGCGPLLVTGAGNRPAKVKDWKIAIPGVYTTAALLLRLYEPQCQNLVTMRFDRIMDAVASGKVDGGVIIHESRFTYPEKGLSCVQDLGTWWEGLSGMPIPLGCIAARKSLGSEIISEIDNAIRESLKWTIKHPEACKDYIREHAQELDETVTADHIQLYVNDFSIDIGREGKAAVAELFRRGREARIFTGNSGGKI